MIHQLSVCWAHVCGVGLLYVLFGLVCGVETSVAGALRDDGCMLPQWDPVLQLQG